MCHAYLTEFTESKAKSCLKVMLFQSSYVSMYSISRTDISQPINVQFLDSDPAGSASIANRAVPNQFPANSGYSLDSARPSHAYADQGAYHGLDFKHHNYEKMTKFLRQTSSRYPNLTALYSIGKSVQGKLVAGGSSFSENLALFSL